MQYILHSVEDVTEQVLAERRALGALHELSLIQQRSGGESEHRLLRAQRAGRVGSFDWLIKDNRIICTPEFEALYGLPPGSFQPGFDAWKMLLEPDDAKRVVAELKACMACHQLECVYGFRVGLPWGKTRWLRGQAQITYDRLGAPERMMGVNFDIDAQKLAEAHLRDSEERLRAIVDGTCEYIGLWAPDGTLLETNRSSLEFAHSARQDVVGKAFWQGPWFVNTPGAPELLKEAVQRVALGESVCHELTLRRPNGETPTFDILLHPIRNEHGEVVLIVPEGRNISEHKEYREQLRHQWRLFDTALSNTPDFVYTFDLQGRFTYANHALLSLLHRSLDEVTGKNFFELDYSPELAERLQQQINRVIETRQSIRDETPFTGPGKGESRDYEYIFAPVVGGDGQVRAVAGSTRDVTERNHLPRALAASERKLQSVFAQAPVAICVLRGKDFVVEMANPTYQGLLPGRQLVGRRFADAIPEVGQHVWDALRQVWETGETFVANDWHVPYDSDNDGVIEDHWFNVAYTPLRDLDDAITGLITVLADVTVPLLARKELERVNKELEEFSYVVSHDLQEPLRMVNIYAHLLLKRMSSDDLTMQQYAEFIRQGVHRMGTLLTDLLSFSRAVHREDLPVGIADLSAAFAEARAVMSSRIEESEARITVGPLPCVRGDTQQLAHVFQDLISNAVKYRRPGLTPEIKVSAEQQGLDWLVSIQDNGIGFDQQYAERIFGLFKRLHKEEYPGTGLGLAICQRIVSRYGGRMWAQGSRGRGATFYFSLPAAAKSPGFSSKREQSGCLLNLSS